jgi:hypothetical protein
MPRPSGLALTGTIRHIKFWMFAMHGGDHANGGLAGLNVPQTVHDGIAAQIARASEATPVVMTIESVASLSDWATPIILLLSAALAAHWSRRTIKENRRIAREKATLDLIERSETHGHYQSLYENFRHVREDSGGLSQLIQPTNPALQKQRQDVLAFLNHYELISLGCHKGILDEELYKKWMRSAVVRDWEAAEAFIVALRYPDGSREDGKRRPALFEHFEGLATQWGARVQYSFDLFRDQSSHSGGATGDSGTSSD